MRLHKQQDAAEYEAGQIAAIFAAEGHLKDAAEALGSELDWCDKRPDTGIPIHVYAQKPESLRLSAATVA